MVEEKKTKKEENKIVNGLSLLIDNYLNETEELTKLSVVSEIMPRLNNLRVLLDIAKGLEYFPKEVYERFGGRYNGLLLRTIPKKEIYNFGSIRGILEAKRAS